METKRSLNQLKAYLPVNLTDAASAFLRLCISLAVLVSAACTQNTVNQTNPPVSQANPNTRVSDPDDWTGGGTGDGGGGQGVLCGEDLVVRDVYEAKNNYRRTMQRELLGPRGTEKVETESIDFLLKALRKSFGPQLVRSEFSSVKFWSDFADKIEYVPEGSKLYPSNDANSPLALPQGCKIVQIAYWDESSGLIDQGTLYVDKTHWMKLDQFNKVALLAHEYFFKLARISGFENSDYTRNKVGQLLSAEGLPSLFPKWTSSGDPKFKDILPENAKGYKYCTGTTNTNRTRFTLYQYQDSAGTQVVSIPKIEVGNFRMPPFESVVRDLSKFRYGVMFFDEFSPFEERVEQNRPGRESLLRNGPDSLMVFQFPLRDQYGTIEFMKPEDDENVLEHARLLPQSELIVLINRRIEDVIQSAFFGSPEENVESDRKNEIGPDGAVLAVVNVLKDEVNQAMKGNSYPKEFPKWTAMLQQLEKKTGRGPSHYDKPELVARLTQYYYQSIPAIMYRIYSGSYEWREISKFLGAKGFTEIPQKLSRKPVRVRVGSEEFNLDLNCTSYVETQERINSGEEIN